MDKSEIKKLNLNDSGFLLFVDSDEKTIYEASGFINDSTTGKLVLTDKKLFFFFVSNISRDKIFIASQPYIVSVSLKEGLISSTLVINNKKESFTIKKLNKNEAKTFYSLLNDIIEKNKKTPLLID
ncbi:MAG TPA: PH domain-containing protein [Candidatus Lokiarchaeia archaeon]